MMSHKDQVKNARMRMALPPLESLPAVNPDTFKPQADGWTVFRGFLGAVLLFIGFGTCTLFVLFLIFLFPRGTSSGSMLGLMMLAPPLLIAIAIAIGLGYAISPRKDPRK